MGTIETIKVVNFKKKGKGFLIINLLDFDEAIHTKWEDRKEKIVIKSEKQQFEEKILDKEKEVEEKRKPGRPKKQE